MALKEALKNNITHSRNEKTVDEKCSATVFIALKWLCCGSERRGFLKKSNEGIVSSV